jgi:Holliday junction resolvase
MSRSQRTKGQRVEREIVNAHKALGVHAERVPLSGAARYQGGGHDVDIYARGKDAAPLVCEVKARKSGAGFVTLEGWLGEYDALFLKRNNAEPLVVLPWRVWEELLGAQRQQPGTIGRGTSAAGSSSSTSNPKAVA